MPTTIVEILPDAAMVPTVTGTELLTTAPESSVPVIVSVNDATPRLRYEMMARLTVGVRPAITSSTLKKYDPPNPGSSKFVGSSVHITAVLKFCAGIKSKFSGADVPPLEGVVTVKRSPLLATPATVTTTFPAPAVPGTVAVITVALQLVTAAVTPLNITVLVPCEAPKLAPLIVTSVPTGPVTGPIEVIDGTEAAEYVNVLVLLPPAELNAFTGPVVLVGACTTIVLSDCERINAETPLN